MMSVVTLPAKQVYLLEMEQRHIFPKFSPCGVADPTREVLAHNPCNFCLLRQGTNQLSCLPSESNPRQQATAASCLWMSISLLPYLPFSNSPLSRYLSRSGINFGFEEEALNTWYAVDRSLDREPLQACLHATTLGSGYVHQYAHQKKKIRKTVHVRIYVHTA